MRFNYIAYDETSLKNQMDIKGKCIELETLIKNLGVTSDLSRPQSLALTALEEVYMWTGKAIRDEQLSRTNAVCLQENRSNE